MLNSKYSIFAIFLLIISLIACEEEAEVPFERDFQTEKVIIVLMDGPRYSETWGHPTHEYIPRLSNDLANQGVINTAFFNNGNTFTVSGHNSISTGNYENLQNTGLETPQNPSIFQLFIGAHQKDTTAAWIISSKRKLEVLSNSKSIWANQNRPATDCGTNGIGSSDRQDSITLQSAKNILTTYQPELALINFKDPDTYGHLNQWDNYLKGIVKTDEYIYQIWDFIQQDSFIKAQRLYLSPMTTGGIWIM